MPSYSSMAGRDRSAVLAAYDAASRDNFQQQRIDLARDRMEFDQAFKTAESSRRAEQEAFLRTQAEQRNQALQDRLSIAEASQALHEQKQQIDQAQTRTKQELTNKFMWELGQQTDEGNPVGSEGWMRRVASILPKYSGLAIEKGSIVEQYATDITKKLTEIEDAKAKFSSLGSLKLPEGAKSVVVDTPGGKLTIDPRSQDEQLRERMRDLERLLIRDDLPKEMQAQFIADWQDTRKSLGIDSTALRNERQQELEALHKKLEGELAGLSGGVWKKKGFDSKLEELNSVKKQLNYVLLDENGKAPAQSRPAAQQNDIPTLTEKSQFDALPPGAEYMRNGIRYRKPDNAPQVQRAMPADLMEKARAAITAGKDPLAVKKRLQDNGFDPSGLNDLATPQPSATAPSNLTPEDHAAIAWANANPTDPRAAAIKKKLGL